MDSPPESSGSSEPAMPEHHPANNVLEPSRKRIKKDQEDDHDMKEDVSTEEVDQPPPILPPTMDDQKSQLAAFLSVLAQQTPLNPSVKQMSSAGPSKSIDFHLFI